MNSIGWTAARIRARLMVWDALMTQPDPIKRRLLIRVYTRMAVKGWVYAE